MTLKETQSFMTSSAVRRANASLSVFLQATQEMLRLNRSSSIFANKTRRVQTRMDPSAGQSLDFEVDLKSSKINS